MDEKEQYDSAGEDFAELKIEVKDVTGMAGYNPSGPTGATPQNVNEPDVIAC